MWEISLDIFQCSVSCDRALLTWDWALLSCDRALLTWDWALLTYDRALLTFFTSWPSSLRACTRALSLSYLRVLSLSFPLLSVLLSLSLSSLSLSLSLSIFPLTLSRTCARARVRSLSLSQRSGPDHGAKARDTRVRARWICARVYARHLAGCVDALNSMRCNMSISHTHPTSNNSNYYYLTSGVCDIDILCAA